MSDANGQCPLCKQPAYLGLTKVECSNDPDWTTQRQIPTCEQSKGVLSCMLG